MVAKSSILNVAVFLDPSLKMLSCTKTCPVSCENQSLREKCPKTDFFFVRIFVFGLNTKIYSVNLCIQSEYSKIQSRKTYVFGHFSRSASFFLLFRNVATFIKSYFVFLCYFLQYDKLFLISLLDGCYHYKITCERINFIKT